MGDEMDKEQLIEMLESAMAYNTLHIRSAVMAELLNNVIGYVQDAAAPSPVAQPQDYQEGDWLIDGGLMYTLKDGANNYEVNVTMVNGSRAVSHRNEFASELVKMLNQPLSPVAQDERLDPHFILQLAGGKLSFDSQSGLVAFANTVIAEYKARAATPAQDKQAGSQQEAVDAALVRSYFDAKDAADKAFHSSYTAAQWSERDALVSATSQKRTEAELALRAAMQAQGERG